MKCSSDLRRLEKRGRYKEMLYYKIRSRERMRFYTDHIGDHFWFFLGRI